MKPILVMDEKGIQAAIPYGLGTDGLSVVSSLTWEEIDEFRRSLRVIPDAPRDPYAAGEVHLRAVSDVPGQL